jgi:hypothetical protein
LEPNEIYHYKSTPLALDQPSTLSQRILTACQADLEHPFVSFVQPIYKSVDHFTLASHVTMVQIWPGRSIAWIQKWAAIGGIVDSVTRLS